MLCILKPCCKYIACTFCERLGGSYRDTSVALLLSKWRWQHSNMVTLQGDQWQAFLWVKEHFWRHPARLFDLRGLIIRGTCMSTIRMTFFSVFSFHILPTAQHLHTHFNHPSCFFWPDFDSHRRKLACEGRVVLCDKKTFFIPKVEWMHWFWKVVLH